MSDGTYLKEDKQEEGVKEELQEALLSSAYTEISQLKRTNKALMEQQLKLRDEVALRCYIEIFKDVGDAKQSAVDAYKIADAFLRVRETGGIDDDKPNKE